MKEFVLRGSDEGPELNIDYDNELNDEQLPVVKGGDGPTLVLAGAGSGKTRTITYRVAWLLEHGVHSSNILLLTFTNKAAKEMIGRVEKLLGRYPQGLWAGTFHSVANRILRRYAPRLGYGANFSILDQDDAREMLKLCVKELKIKPVGMRFPKASVLHGVISYAQNTKGEFEKILDKKYEKLFPLRAEISSVAKLYEQKKKEQNAMDFDDLLLNLMKLLEEHEDVRKELSNSFHYILVDEFQDTNVIQAEIVRKLAEVHRNVLVVGDDAQSIYSFRAADIRNILRFPEEYQGAGMFRLVKNYRSTPEILRVANLVIEQNSDQFEKELQAICPNGEKPNVVPAQSGREEATYIAEQIEDLHAEGVPYNEISVLFRAAFHSQSLEFELMKRRIPYEYRGGMKFFERSHIKDAVAHIRVIHNVKDGMAWIRLMKMHPGIGLVTANKIAEACGLVETFDQVGLLQPVKAVRAKAGWQRFLNVHRALTTARPNPSDYIRALAGSDEYQEYLQNEFPNFRERMDDIEQFALFAEQYSDLGAFLEAVSLTDEYNENDEPGRTEDRIVLSTIHQAKGLEWEHVFVIHLAEGMFPNQRATEEEGGLEEERRLFYVAVTRARKGLYLTYPMTSGYEHVEIRQPSEFIDSLPPDSVEHVRLKRAFSSGGYGRPRESSRKTSRYDDDEPTIVLDDMGERVKRKPSPPSFLRDIDDLG